MEGTGWQCRPGLALAGVPRLVLCHQALMRDRRRGAQVHVVPYQEGLEELEGAEQPHVQVGLHLRGRAVEGVGHHQE